MTAVVEPTVLERPFVPDRASGGSPRVAWLTHRVGTVGGAELADSLMVSRAPEGVRVQVLPSNLDVDLSGYDYFVVGGTDGMTDWNISQVWDNPVVVWSHDVGDPYHPLLSAPEARVIALTPLHKEYLEQRGVKVRDVNLGWFDIRDVFPGEKEPWALWAHRDVAHKGLEEAREWAMEKGVPLREVTDVSRDYVLSLMRTATWFVLLSRIFDPGPWSCIEALLSGCELVVNEKVGLPEERGVNLEMAISLNDLRFWNTVLR